MIEAMFIALCYNIRIYILFLYDKDKEQCFIVAGTGLSAHKCLWSQQICLKWAHVTYDYKGSLIEPQFCKAKFKPICSGFSLIG